MYIIALTLAFLCWTITTTIVNGNECECEWNLARNEFFGNQECFSAYRLIRRNLIAINNSAMIDNVTSFDTLINTLCYGHCGNALNRILYYADRVLDRSTDQVSKPYMYIATYVDINGHGVFSL